MNARAWVEASAQAIELLAVVVVVVVVLATVRDVAAYLRRRLPQARTFVSWSLMLEIEGRWPWQRQRAVNVALHGAADDRPPSRDRTAERAA
jgi:hypothetical protein